MVNKQSSNSYSASSIQVLKGLEAVRKRPAMYIGSVDKKGLHHLFDEIIHNFIDEAMEGNGTRGVTKLLPDGYISIEDDGRGIPTGMHPKENRSALEVVMTVLHAGGKFNQDSYKVSGGLHGVGVSCVNALSSHLKATVHREGKIFEQSYRRGIPEESVRVIGESDKTGTTILFKPDDAIFSNTDFDYEHIANRLRELAYLNPGLILDLEDLRTANEEGEHRKNSFCFEGGLGSFIEYLEGSREAILPKPILIKNEEDNFGVEVAMMYNTGSSEHIVSYANTINTFEGGTHIMGFKRGFTRAMKAYGDKTGTFDRAKASPSGDDFREGVTAILSIKMQDPQFAGQHKGRLTNENVAARVEPVVFRGVETFLEENPKLASIIMRKGILAHQARQAARRARDLIQRKSSLIKTALPGKLTDCSERDPALCEIFLLEGDSAAGTMKDARRRDIQAILPLRGKILNIEKAQEHRLYESEQIRNIITALGITFEETEEGRITNLDKLRYHKIVIMTDADVDGSHIRTLILTLFFRHMPELIRRGFVYIALPPLFLVKKSKESRYCWTEGEREAAILELSSKGKGELMITRYKGLGEMNPDQLYDTTLNPATRALKQVTIDCAIEADRIFSILMGDNIPLRREMIEANAKKVDANFL
jgi:DNA gyrase subunit B